MSFCSKCGLKNPDESRFCTNCGNTLLAPAGDVNTEAVQNESDAKQPEPHEGKKDTLISSSFSSRWWKKITRILTEEETKAGQGKPDFFAWRIVANTVMFGIAGLVGLITVGYLLAILSWFFQLFFALRYTYKDAQLINASQENLIKKKEIAWALIPFVYLFIRASRTGKKATPAFACLGATLLLWVLNIAVLHALSNYYYFGG